MFREKLSETCRNRAILNKSTSRHFIFVADCASDTVNFLGNRLHKQVIGFILIMFDIVSTLFMMHVFHRLYVISEEYRDTINEHELTMSDFTVMCRNVRLDRYTQHPTLIKMRIWLHYNSQLKEADKKKYGKLANTEIED